MHMHHLLTLALIGAIACVASGSAIKGHTAPAAVVRAHDAAAESSRSIKLAPAANSLAEQKPVAAAAAAAAAPVAAAVVPAVAAQQPVVAPAVVKAAAAPQPAVPILESSKKIYNDESIRRLAQQPSLFNSEPVVKPAVFETTVAAASKPVEQPAVVAAVASSPVVQPPVVEPRADKPQEPKKAAEEPLVKPSAVVKEQEPLPAQSDRSAPVKPVVVVEPVVPVVAPVAAPAEQPVVAVEQQQQPKQADLQAKNDEPEKIEVPAPDPGLVLSAPIDSTTKLLIDLDEHVQKFLPADEQQQAAAAVAKAEPSAKEAQQIAHDQYSPQVSGKSSAPLAPYSSSGVAEDPIAPVPVDAGIVPSGGSPGASASAAAGAASNAAASGQAAPPSPVAAVSQAAASSQAASSGLQSVSSTGAAAAVLVSAPSATRQASSSSSSSHHNNQHQNQQQVITQLLEQLDSLQNRIQDTINQLVARRRYVMSALLRPMGTYVRRVRTNLERLQNRVNQLQAAASSVSGNGNRPGGFVDAAAIETIRRRIDDISKRISDIVNRIRFSLTPTSAPISQSNGRR